MGGAEMEEPAMAESAERLRGELSDKLELIRRAEVFEEFPGDLEEDALAADGRRCGTRGGSAGSELCNAADAHRRGEQAGRVA